jgi:hypothetical protein
MTKNRLLLVEGRDDQHVIYALRDAHNIPDVFDVTGKDGIDPLLESIPVELKASDRERLAVIVDADENLSARWDQLRYRINKAVSLELPKEPSPEGTILQIPDGPRLGIWIMPDNQVSGLLEHFLAFLIPQGDSLLPLVDSFLASIPAALRRFSSGHSAKARIHSWLALQKEPGKPLGQAITYRYLEAKAEVVQPFLKWLRAALVD